MIRRQTIPAPLPLAQPARAAITRQTVFTVTKTAPTEAPPSTGTGYGNGPYGSGFYGGN